MLSAFLCFQSQLCGHEVRSERAYTVLSQIVKGPAMSEINCGLVSILTKIVSNLASLVPFEPFVVR